MSVIRLLVLACATSLLASCGTVFGSSTDKIAFSSEPDAASVYVNGQLMGKTPTELALPNKHPINVEFRKDGYERRTVVVNSSVKGAFVVLDIVPGFVLGVIPLLVDAATGNWNGLEQSHVHATLDPIKSSP